MTSSNSNTHANHNSSSSGNKNTTAAAGAGSSANTSSSSNNKSSSGKSKTVTKASGAAGTQAKAKKPSAASRKKKPGSSGGGSAKHRPVATQAILNHAKAATADKIKQRKEADARRTDPLWYKMEDVVADGTTGSGSSSILPEQVQVVEQVLATYGLNSSDVTPQAMACLLEQSRRFANELLSMAADLAYHAGRPSEITQPDLQLAMELRGNAVSSSHNNHHNANQPQLHQLAHAVNHREPLPPYPSHCPSGVLLPPTAQTQMARTYDIVSAQRVERKMVLPRPASAWQKRKQAAQTTSYGAGRGRQIPIKLTSSSTATISATPMDTSTAAS